ncbi:MAG TPA: tetratricopeptide repeat protein [Bryobacteraceae bacterium]|nr:tetratricopeptide repeat protein [Bryobacteraceae bacterium]
MRSVLLSLLLGAAVLHAGAVDNQTVGAYLQKMRETADGIWLDKASKLVEQMLREDPASYEARKRRIEIELFRHEFTSVIQHSRELTAVRPGDPDNWGTLGDAFMERGGYDDAADAYQEMVSLRHSLASYNRVAFYRFVTGDAEGAIEIMEKAVDMGGLAGEHVAWCLTDLGHMYFKTGNVAKAEESYRRALLMFPNYHRALAGLANALAATGRLHEAIASLEHAQAIVPLPEYASMLEALYSSAGRTAAAAHQRELLGLIDALGRARGEKANRALAFAFADQNRNLTRALELATAELDYRRDVYTYDALAWALYRNGRYVEAEENMLRALAQNTPEPAFAFHAGMIASALGRTDEASRHFRRAATLNPDFDVRFAAELRAALRPPAGQTAAVVR